MSGLCGIVHGNGRPATAEALEAMMQAAAHRGPDGTGTWRSGPVGLAHLALHVTPENHRDDQPLVDKEGGLGLVADARIDNRDVLQRQLRGALRTDRPTDADLILAAYRQWGTDCASYLLGDFAFAVWDAREQRLFAARDPMAMRPFYYRAEPSRFLFASEVKQLLAAPDVPATIHDGMVALHLCGRFDRLGWTYYAGVHQLKPAHALTVECDGTHRKWRYWDIDPDHRIRYTDERDYIEHFRELFAKAIRCRLRSTKPVGLFLSGGLDSGSIASMMGYLRENEGIGAPGFLTYSWAFPTLTQCDERHISDHIVAHYALPSTAIDAEAASLIGPPDGVSDADDPHFGPYRALLTEGLRRARSDGVKRMLSGQRGDLLVGEWLFDYLGLLEDGHWITLWNEFNARKRETGFARREAIRQYLYMPLRARMREWLSASIAQAPQLQRLVRQQWRSLRPDSPDHTYPPWAAKGLRARVALPAPRESIPPDLTGHTRRARCRRIKSPIHMATATGFERLCSRHGMTFADPWSDRRLIEFVMAIPQRVICQHGKNKYLVYQSMEGIMPEAARRAAGKVDPYPLFGRALKDEERNKVQTYLDNASSSYLDKQELSTYFEDYCHGKRYDSRFWYALSCCIWQSETNF